MGRSQAIRASILWAAMAAVACGDSGRVPPSSPAAPVSTTESPDAAAPEASDIAPPPTLAWWLVAKQPARDLPVLSYLFPSSDPFASLFADPRSSLANVLGATVAELAVLERPLVLGMTRDQRFCGSMSIVDEDRFRSVVGRENDFLPADGGVLRIVPKAGARKVACSLYPGREGRRLVCGPDEKVVADAGRFLASPAAEETGGAAVRFVSLRISSRAVFDDSPTDALDDAYRLGRDAVASYARDLERSIFDLSLDSGALELSIEQVFRGVSSPLTAAWMGGAVEQGYPDEAWSLPADSDVALFVSSRDSTGLRAAWAPYLSGMFPASGAPTGSVRPDVEALQGLAFSGAPFVVALGVERHEPGARAGAARNWGLVHVERPIEDWSRQLQAAFSPPKSAPRKDKTKPPSDKLEVRKRTKASLLPQGTRHFVYVHAERVTTSKGAAAKTAPRPSPWHMLLAPSRRGTWLAWSDDEATATARLMGAHAGTGGTRAAADLSRLAQAKGIVIGFASLAGVMSLLESASSGDDSESMPSAFARTAKLTHRGRTRVPFTVVLLPPDERLGSGHFRTRLSARLEAQALGDLARFYADEAGQ